MRTQTVVRPIEDNWGVTTHWIVVVIRGQGRETACGHQHRTDKAAHRCARSFMAENDGILTPVASAVAINERNSARECEWRIELCCGHILHRAGQAPPRRARCRTCADNL